VANKTYSLKNQKKLKVFLEKQENGSNTQSDSRNDKQLSKRTQADKASTSVILPIIFLGERRTFILHCFMI
jgi:hypothetical protein